METAPSPAPCAHRLPAEGDIIDGKYRVEQVIGRGGMGLVVAAQHTSLRQRVAIKFLLPEAMSIPEATGRFVREAQAAAAIQSEHVARVLDVSATAGGSPYMVMEYLTGVHLGQHLRARGPLPVAEAVDYVLQACEAIAEAHALGIIHRDLKPANLFLTHRADGSPLVKVLDFGLSKPTRPDSPTALDQSLTAANTVLGSPHYMSPEQIRCLKDIDGRSDVWSLGVILYQLLSGRRPFQADSMAVMFIIIAADPPAPLGVLRPDLPPALVDVVMRCLEKDVTKRVQSVAELARSLAPFGEESAWVSVDRISRVLAESAPPPRPTLASIPGGIESTMAMAKTIAAPGDDAADTAVRTRAAARARKLTISVAAAIVSLVAMTTAAALGIVSPRREQVSAAAPPAPAPSATEIALAAPAERPFVEAKTEDAPVPSAAASADALPAPTSRPAAKPAGSSRAPAAASPAKAPRRAGDPMDRWN